MTDHGALRFCLAYGHAKTIHVERRAVRDPYDAPIMDRHQPDLFAADELGVACALERRGGAGRPGRESGAERR